MKNAMTAVLLLSGLLAGCATFQDVGHDAQATGAAVKEEFGSMGPALKKGFADIGEGFTELGQGIAEDFREAAREIKR